MEVPIGVRRPTPYLGTGVLIPFPKVAPEVIEMKGISTAADIWSLGATIIELIAGKPPYHHMDNGMAVMYRIVDEDMEIPEGFSPSLVDFLTRCFRKNAKDRPTAEDLFEHEWVKSRLGLDPVSTPTFILPCHGI